MDSRYVLYPTSGDAAEGEEIDPADVEIVDPLDPPDVLDADALTAHLRRLFAAEKAS